MTRGQLRGICADGGDQHDEAAKQGHEMARGKDDLPWLTREMKGTITPLALSASRD